MATQSDDARRVLAEFTDEPASIFGVSIGGAIGFDLALRHPEQLRTLVAFEPPLLQLLMQAERAEIPDPAKADNPAQAIDDLARSLGVARDLTRGAVDPELAARRKVNTLFFLAHEANALDDYSFQRG
jgi:pimeloyl-ACP methyl ester carboxylesterase